jgi:hypothetical protein
MRDKFINQKIVGVIYSNLQKKFQLNLDNEDKTKLTKKTVKVMNEVYSNIDAKRVNEKNIDNVLKQFVNNCYTIVYNDLNKDTSSAPTTNTKKVESFAMENKMDRDRQLNRNSQPRLDPRAENMRSFETRGGYARDDNFASFDSAFQTNQRSAGERREFQGRIEPPIEGGGGRKSDFKDGIDKKYQSMQADYRQSFNNARPTTPPELKGDGGANLNKLARENLKNKNNQNQQNQNRSDPRSDSRSDPRSDPRTSNNSKYPGSKDTFDFGTANDMENNYDTLDGNKGNF